MLLPLCNYLGIMLVGLIPLSKSPAAKDAKSVEASPAHSVASTASSSSFSGLEDGGDEPERTSAGVREHEATVDDADGWGRDAAMSPSMYALLDALW